MAGKTTITAEGYEKLCDLFDELSEIPPPDRQTKLAAIEAGDAELAALLKRMLAIEAEGGAGGEMKPIVDLAGALDEGDDPDDEPASPLLPTAIGPYQVISQLGWGSVGDVYLARQAKPAERRVAVKLLRFARRPSETKRYAVEARALSSLSHPGIAQIFDAGVTSDGRPYLAMEYVDGTPIDAACRELDREARLRLFIDLCGAVHYAHQQGVIHRDLKPSNVLVTRDEAENLQVKVIDFGIARLTGELAEFHQTMTMHGELLGTLAYMSPEQLLGRRVDTRADIYALGVILHLLLTNQLPHDLAGKSLGDALRIVSHQSPTRRLAADRMLRGDLETIVGAAMHRDPRHRYDSVHALGEDVARHLRFEPITVRRPGRWYVARKFLRRNRLFSAVAAVILLMLVVGVYMIDDARRDALAARGEAERQQQEAERQYLEARRMSGFFLHDVVTRLERLPGSTGIRTDLTAEILRQTRGFIEERPNDPSVLDDHARALIAKANLLQTGTFPRDHRGAWPYVVEAVAVREHLAERWPDHPDYQMELALAYTRRGDVARELGNHGNVLDDYHRALEIHRRLVELAPESRRYLDNLFWDYNRIGARLHHQGDSSALTWHRDAMEVARQLERRFPDHYLTTYALSQAHIHMAEQYERRGEDESALEHARRAVVHADLLNEMYPHSWHFMRQHRRVTLAHAKIVQQNGNDAEKFEAFTRFRRAAEAMHQIEPGNSVWARDVERARQWLAELHR